MVAKYIQKGFSLYFFLLIIFVIQFPINAETIIRDITVNDTAESQIIVLGLNTDKPPVTQLDKGQGWIRLDIKDSKYTGREKVIKLEGGFLSNIKIYQIGNDVLLEVLFSDIFYSPQENQFSLNNSRTQIALHVSRNKKSQNSVQNNSQPTEITVAQKLGIVLDKTPDNSRNPKDFSGTDQSADIKAGYPTGITGFDYDLKSNVFNMLFGLLLLLGLGYIILYFLNRFGFKKYRVKHDKYSINILNTKVLGPKQKIVIMEINGRKFVCGVTREQINYLTLVPEEMEQECDSLLNTPQMTVPALRTLLMKRRKEMLSTQNNNTTQADDSNESSPSLNTIDPDAEKNPRTRTSFQEEFLNKIKGFKKIK